ncbi:HNH endonuclease [Pseudogemmobacter humi]|uniref:HNH endonuclease n=1 Tax=Pseudogemmobacter humi TaxID=2483812 RepID=A0A3P5XQD0_9RHOB|nr:HNH endonuclease [Pseudogemmobacter humi]VDC30111.1 HNH endonuclease [Pseudogemmobacter humi]
MSPSLSGLRTLVLNADMQPLSWAPLSVWSWEDAFVAVHQERVVQVKSYEDVVIRSASREFEVPAVVALKSYRKRKKVAFTRYHVFLRDQFTCQYCGRKFEARDLTFDHVVPRSRGGQSNWTNIVAACGRDNLRKGSMTVAQAGMKLLRPPFEPTVHQLDRAARSLPVPRGDLHQTWMDFLYWDAELEG